MKFGWGSAIGKIFSWVPSKRQVQQEKINKLKREINELQNRKSYDGVTATLYVARVAELFEAEEKLKAIDD